MNFATRFGWSLLLFGSIALGASFFGYAPRKLANLSPTAVKVAAVAFMSIGGLSLLCGGDPRMRRRVFIGLGAVGGLAAVLILAAVGYGVYQRQKRSSMPPPSPPSWTQPPPAPTAGGPAPRPTASAATPTGGASAMTAYYDQKRTWEREFGRERVWSVVVHLSGAEPPANFEARLRALVATKSGGGAVVGRTGGIAHASVAPLDNEAPLRAALVELFPGARVQVVAAGRQATVFAAPSGAPRS